MSNNSWNQTISTLQSVGPTLTAAAAASMLPGQGKFTFPANLLKIGDPLKFIARGIMSCAATTPGTGTFDIRFGSTVVFSTGAINLNTTGKTGVPWTLDVDLVMRSVGSGTLATLWAQGTFASEAIVGAVANASGGNSVLNVPVGSLAISAGFDSTTSFVIDSFWTPSLATASLTCQMARLNYDG